MLGAQPSRQSHTRGASPRDEPGSSHRAETIRGRDGLEVQGAALNRSAERAGNSAHNSAADSGNNTPRAPHKYLQQTKEQNQKELEPFGLEAVQKKLNVRKTSPPHRPSNQRDGWTSPKSNSDLSSVVESNQQQAGKLNSIHTSSLQKSMMAAAQNVKKPGTGAAGKVREKSNYNQDLIDHVHISDLNNFEGRSPTQDQININGSDGYIQDITL